MLLIDTKILIDIIYIYVCIIHFLTSVCEYTELSTSICISIQISYKRNLYICLASKFFPVTQAHLFFYLIFLKLTSHLCVIFYLDCILL